MSQKRTSRQLPERKEQSANNTPSRCAFRGIEDWGSVSDVVCSARAEIGQRTVAGNTLYWSDPIMQRRHAHAEKADLMIAAHTALLIDVEVKALVQAAHPPDKEAIA